MNLQGDSLLARAAFAEDKNAGVLVRRNSVDARLKRSDLAALAEQLASAVTIVVRYGGLDVRLPCAGLHSVRQIAGRRGVKRLVLVVAIVELRRGNQRQVCFGLSRSTFPVPRSLFPVHERHVRIDVDAKGLADGLQ